MNACDACGLKRDAANFSRHNCFEVIKQLGRSELAAELLGGIASMDDSTALDHVRQKLRTESKAMPDIEGPLARTA